MDIKRLVMAGSMVLLVTQCAMQAQAPKPAVGRAGALSSADTLYFMGVDFTRATFHDPYIRHDDLLNGKIPSWNQKVLEDIRPEFKLRVEDDLKKSTARNKTVPESAVRTDAGSSEPSVASQAELRTLIAPYVDAKTKGPALIILVDRLTKRAVVGHWVLFDRKTGDILVANPAAPEPGGFGVHNYYLNGLKEIADSARKVINGMVR